MNFEILFKHFTSISTTSQNIQTIPSVVNENFQRKENEEENLQKKNKPHFVWETILYDYGKIKKKCPKI